MNIPKIISRILDPMALLGAMTIVAIFKSGLQGQSLFLFLTVFLIGSVVFPAVLLWWAIVHKKISNWDISNRTQRFIPLTILIVCLGLDLAFALFLQNKLLASLFSLYLVYLVGFFCITMYWKISGHTGAISLATGLLIIAAGWSWWPVLSLVPLVAWARVAGKYHTAGQAIGGIVYSWSLLILASGLFII